jgi:hypothetical protein
MARQKDLARGGYCKGHQDENLNETDLGDDRTKLFT